jgi:hypothetical protein
VMGIIGRDFAMGLDADREAFWYIPHAWECVLRL